MRGLVAEFLVATALDSAEAVRMEWDACDVVTSDGVRVEVKSAAYIQAWEQRTFSSIRFGVGERRTWEAIAGNWTDEPHRNADVYVFCLLDHRDQSTIDPLDVSQWRFYVASTALLDTLGRQKSIGLASVVALGVEPVEFHDIATSVRAATNATG